MDLEFKQKQSVLTKYYIDPDTKKPTTVPITEKQQVHPLKNLIQMVGEVKKNKKIQIIDRDMIAVSKPEKITQPYHYYVDYEQNLIHFHPDVAGQTIEYKYEDMGVTVISANKIFTKQDEKGNVVELLQEIIDLGREAIDVMLTIGGVAIIMKRLEDDIKEGYEISDKIQADIQQAKDEILNVRGNKEVIIKSSDWVLNDDIYEKEITHPCNSENLHVTAKNADTKKACTVGWQVLDKTRILLKSDEAINMSVILSASYYHATQTISDDIAEEVVKARKGETGLDVKITKINEELTGNTNEINALKPKIDNINEQLDNKASKQEVDVERKRIDSLSKLEEGSTTGDAELIDGRISQSGLVFPNVGENIRNVDRILNTTVLNYEKIADYDYDYISTNKDSNGMVYVKYNVKKGDIYEIETECKVNHTVTLVKSIPVNKTLSNFEVYNTSGNIFGKRFVSNGDYVAIMFWANDITNLRKIVVKKINYNDDLLRASKIGSLGDLFKINTLINESINGLSSNILYKAVTLKKGNFYRINVRTKTKNKYSLYATTKEESFQSDTSIINDTTSETTNYIFYADKTYNYIRVYEEKGLNDNIHLIVEEFDLSFINKGKYERIIYIAASDSSDYDKANADIVCTGVNDERVFNKAIASLVYGGTIQLFDGNYYFDEFSTMNNSCVFVQNNGYGRTITIKGTTENKSYLSRYGVTIHVTEKAYSTLQDGVQYCVFNTDYTKVPLYQVECYPNNINFENIYIYLFNAQKKVVGINGSYFGSMAIDQVGVYNKDYFYYRFNRLRPPTPVEGCIGILSVKGANDEMAKIYMNCANAGGLWCGITIKGVEHLIMNTCTSSRNVYGYEFVGRCDKTLTVINCADEGNRHLPIFKETGSATIIDFCIERLHDEVIPYDPNGSTEPFATEDTTNGWKGFISYRIQGNALGVYNFWKNGHGRGFKTVNLSNELCGTTRPKNPDYLCEFFDTTTNKILRWNGEQWIDAMGNIIE